MNQDRARDYFSAYYEGTLDGGLRHSFEGSLRSDAGLNSDYNAFAETVRELDGLRDEEIEIPSFLSDRIASRLEEVQGKQRFGFPMWTTWLRGLAFTGLAAVAIAFALPFVKGGDTSNSSIVSGANQDQIKFSFDGSKVVLSYQPSTARTLVVSSPATGKEVRRFDLNGQRVQSPILNDLPGAALFKIEPLGEKNSSMIAIPGTQIAKAKVGSGAIQDLAVALAGHYHVPVVVEAADVTHHVSWNFASADARASANQSVEAEGFSVDESRDGIIRILDR